MATPLMIILFMYVTPIMWFSFYLHRKNLSISHLFKGKGNISLIDIMGSIVMPMIFGVGALILCIGLLAPLLPEVTNMNDIDNNESSAWVFAFNVFTLVFIGPICEEIIFRGYLLGRLSYKYGVKMGIVTSSIVFGMLHLQNVFGAAMFGVIMCIIFIKTNSLKFPVFIHIISNLLISVRDIYYRYFLDGTGASDIPSPLVLITGGLFLLSLSLIWIIPFLRKHWKGTTGTGSLSHF